VRACEAALLAYPRYQPEYDESVFKPKQTALGLSTTPRVPTRAASHTARSQVSRRSHIILPCSPYRAPRRRFMPETHGGHWRPWVTGEYRPFWYCPNATVHARVQAARQRAHTVWLAPPGNVGGLVSPTLVGTRVGAAQAHPTWGASALCRPNSRSSAFGTRTSAPLSTKGSAGHTRPFECCEVPPVWRGHLLRHSDSTVPSGTFGTPRCPYGPPAFR
jgi:hypothetical protein